MLDSILIAQSGLNGFQKGLKTIGNNVANMNTVGFKASTASFSDAYVTDQAGGNANGGMTGFGGAGLDVHAATLDLGSGEVKDTGNEFDAAVDGNAYLVFEDANGNLLYSKDGQFQFDAKNVLTGRVNGLKVVGRTSTGKLAPIDLTALKTNPPKTTSAVTLDGNLTLDQTSAQVSTIKAYDALGVQHSLTMSLAAQGDTSLGVWAVTLLENSTVLTTGTFRYTAGVKDASSDTLHFTVGSGNAQSGQISLSLADSATSIGNGAATLTMKSQDGYASGSLSAASLDEKGVVKLTYTNGQTAEAGTLALAQVDNGSLLVNMGESLYSYSGEPPEIRVADADLKIKIHSVESSNVNLTDEFSNLILMQRGYQASSQVLSTANDMIQELFDMKGRR